eukprot:SAG31_NODE_701_length_12730_cov_3.008709_2_plen_306_part_00
MSLISIRDFAGYQSLQNGGLAAVGAQRQVAGRDPRLGAFDEVSQRFAPAAPTLPPGQASDAPHACAPVTASIRYLHDHDAFAFKLAFPTGATGTLAYPTPRAGQADSGGLPLPNQWAKGPLPLATAFPSFVVPPELQYMQTAGNMLGANFGVANMSRFEGGLFGGPLVIFNSNMPHPRTQQLPAVTLSPLTHHKAVFTSQAQEPERGAGAFLPGLVNASDRVAVGVSGYIDSIPVGYEQEAVLAGRPGITDSYTAWGAVMQANGGSVKYSLEDDVYSRQLHYMTDNGGCSFTAQVTEFEPSPIQL